MCKNTECIYCCDNRECPAAQGCGGYMEENSTEKGKNMERNCSNCLYEYTCSWKPAGDKDCCEEWKTEEKGEGSGI